MPIKTLAPPLDRLPPFLGSSEESPRVGAGNAFAEHVQSFFRGARPQLEYLARQGDVLDGIQLEWTDMSPEALLLLAKDPSERKEDKTKGTWTERLIAQKRELGRRASLRFIYSRHPLVVTIEGSAPRPSMSETIVAGVTLENTDLTVGFSSHDMTWRTAGNNRQPLSGSELAPADITDLYEAIQILSDAIEGLRAGRT